MITIGVCYFMSLNVVPDGLLNLAEVWSVLRVILPGGVHEAKERGGALWGEGQALSQFYLAYDLIILDPHKWLHATHQYLPAAHTWEEKERKRDQDGGGREGEWKERRERDGERKGREEGEAGRERGEGEGRDGEGEGRKEVFILQYNIFMCCAIHVAIYNSLFICCVLPNIQTSLSPVNLLKFILSGAIHFMGSFPLEAAWGRREGGREGGREEGRGGGGEGGERGREGGREGRRDKKYTSAVL